MKSFSSAADWRSLGDRHDRVAHATASQPGTPVNFDVPPNATDCAVHVYEPTRFPYWEGRSYTPEPATLDELRQVLRTLKLERVVVVQATSYGTDNACVVASLRALGARARGVAIIDEKTPESSFDEMHEAGVRSVRLTLNNLAASDPAAARQRLNMTVERLKTRRTGACSSPTNTVTSRDPSRRADGAARHTGRGSFRSGAGR